MDSREVRAFKKVENKDSGNGVVVHSLKDGI